MRIVLLGKNGQVGWELQHTLAGLGDVIPLGRADLDLAAPHTLSSKLTALRPDLIINAAAYTEVDLAETDVALATTVNAQAPGILAEIARQLGAGFIHYSTDYVFDGSKSSPYVEGDTPNPLNMYGHSKLAGEKNITQSGDAYLILRTSWVYSLRGNTFVNKVLKWARSNPTLKIVRDQVSNPTWAYLLANVTAMLIAKNHTNLADALRTYRGIYHVAGLGYTSRYEWAKAILANDPKPTEQLVQAIEPALSRDFPTPATRPSFSALDCSAFTQTFQIDLPTWQASLQVAMQSQGGGRHVS